MALPLPPASNLQAILLVTKSRSMGPRLVFHYPPLSPSAALLAGNRDPRWFSNETTTGSIDSQSSSDDWDSGTENDDGDDDADTMSKASGRGSGRGGSLSSYRDQKHRPGGGGAWGRPDMIDEDDPDDLDTDRNGKMGGESKARRADYDWSTVLGFRVDALEKMLCPTKIFNKRRFELGVENIVFVGAPRFVRDDGEWKKRRRWEKKKAKTPVGDKQQDLTKLADLKLDGSDDGKDTIEPLRYPEGFEPGYGHGLMSGAASGAVSEAGSTRSASSAENGPDMTMFNVVFVLNPPTLEYQMRVKEMYENVARKYAKALKYEQARFNYVWKETRKILNIKQRAQYNADPISVTWLEIINSSPLAKSIAILFDAISNDKIAHVHFDATFDTSFQIPQPVSTPYLPNALEPQMPGLWLTTANVVHNEDDDAPLTQHSALLLLEDTETLVKELESDAKENATPLAFYIRNITPTKSLQKISIKHSIPSQDIEYIAGHLVYWRRARLIPPLHPRDTYIVSPNADFGNLKDAIPAYAARFPTHSSLPKILSILSGTPRPFRSIIPSTEHKNAYMEILAWLMRGGWVTQLRTFAWIRVTAEIKAEVAGEMEREAHIKKAEEDRKQEMEDNESITTDSAFSDTNNNKRSSYLSTQSSMARPATPLRRSQQQRLGAATVHDEEAMDASTILSPRGPAYRGSPARPSSDAGSTGSARTSILNTSGLQNRPASPQQVAMAGQTQPKRPSPLHHKQPATYHPGGHGPGPSVALSKLETPSRSSSRTSLALVSPTYPLSPTHGNSHHPHNGLHSSQHQPHPPQHNNHNNHNNHTSSILHNHNNHHKTTPSPSHSHSKAQAPFPVPASTPTPSPSNFTTSIIPSPHRASAVEARWLEKIFATFTDPELKEAWPMLLRYLDGKHALDDMAVREGMKRTKVAGLLKGISEGGWLVAVRHW